MADFVERLVGKGGEFIELRIESNYSSAADYVLFGSFTDKIYITGYFDTNVTTGTVTIRVHLMDPAGGLIYPPIASISGDVSEFKNKSFEIARIDVPTAGLYFTVSVNTTETVSYVRLYARMLIKY